MSVVDKRLKKAEKLAQQGRIDEAVSMYKAADNAFQAGHLLERIGRYREAAAIFEEEGEPSWAVRCLLRDDLVEDAMRVHWNCGPDLRDVMAKSVSHYFAEYVRRLLSSRGPERALEVMRHVSNRFYWTDWDELKQELSKPATEAGLFALLGEIQLLDHRSIDSYGLVNPPHRLWPVIVTFLRGDALDRSCALFREHCCKWSPEHGTRAANWVVEWPEDGEMEVLQRLRPAQEFYEIQLRRSSDERQAGLLYTLIALGSEAKAWRPWIPTPIDLKVTCIKTLIDHCEFITNFVLDGIASPSHGLLRHTRRVISTREVVQLIQAVDAERAGLVQYILDSLRSRSWWQPYCIALGELVGIDAELTFLDDIPPALLWGENETVTDPEKETAKRRAELLFLKKLSAGRPYDPGPTRFTANELDAKLALGKVTITEYERLRAEVKHQSEESGRQK